MLYKRSTFDMRLKMLKLVETAAIWVYIGRGEVGDVQLSLVDGSSS